MNVINMNVLSPMVEANTRTSKTLEVEDESTASMKPLIGLKASECHWKSAQPSAATLKKLSVSKASSSELPSGGASTDRSNMVDVSTPKPTGTHSRAVGSKSKTGVGNGEEAEKFINKNERLNAIGE